ncbi:MAG: ParB/RepB/Spo0J family partition protein, partial [Yaniella sp.]
TRRNTQQFDELASSLTDLLDTSVKITLGAKKGRIAIDFASVDDLNRIMAVINSESSDAE